MPKMLTKEEYVAAKRVITERKSRSDGLGLTSYEAVIERLLSHLDALTERLEVMADEWKASADDEPHSEASNELRDCATELRALIEEMKG